MVKIELIIMGVPVGTIINIGSKIAEYFGLIEGVSTKVTKLLHQSFNSAKINLEYARNATGQNQIDYIQVAKNKFIEAVTVEENENKVLALAGLAMCQLFLKDDINAQITIRQIVDVELTTSAEVGAGFKGLSLVGFLNPTYGTIEMGNALHQRKMELNSIKSKAQYLCCIGENSNKTSVKPSSSELDYNDIINRI